MEPLSPPANQPAQIEAAPRVRKPRQPKPLAPLDPLTEETRPWFDRIWNEIPKTVIQQDGFKKQEVIVSRGSKKLATERFQKIVDEGYATARELRACWLEYLDESPDVKKGFIQHVCTFFGPEKQTWYEYLDVAREAVREAIEEEKACGTQTARPMNISKLSVGVTTASQTGNENSTTSGISATA